MSMVSNCCFASGDEFVDYGLCPECREHCDFIDDEEEEVEVKPEELK